MSESIIDYADSVEIPFIDNQVNKHVIILFDQHTWRKYLECCWTHLCHDLLAVQVSTYTQVQNTMLCCQEVRVSASWLSAARPTCALLVVQVSTYTQVQYTIQCCQEARVSALWRSYTVLVTCTYVTTQCWFHVTLYQYGVGCMYLCFNTVLVSFTFVSIQCWFRVPMYQYSALVKKARI